MQNFNLFSMVLCSAVAPAVAYAQAPELQQKQTLPSTLLTNQDYSSNEVSVSKLTTVIPGKEYTLEVKGKINSSTGRGLDVVVNDAEGKGFRVSLDAKTLNWNSPMGTLTNLSKTDNTQTRTFRFAVADGQVNIYEDGFFVCTRPIETIDESITRTYGENVNPEVIPASDWGSTKPEPVSKGWTLLDESNNEVKADKWPYSRFEKSPSMKLSYEDGTVYTGNFFLIRWDGGLKNKSYKYVYAVKGLKANTTYRLSMDCAYWNNDNRTTFTVGVSKESTGANSIATYETKTKGKSGRQVLVPNEMTFTTTDEGTYYVYMTGSEALFAIANLQLQDVTETATPMVLIGKNYEGEGSMTVESATYDESGAYAPAEQIGEQKNLNLSDAGKVEQEFVYNSSFTLTGKTELHMVADGNPCSGTQFNLQGDDAWLYFDYVKPSKVLKYFLSYVKINGQAAEDGVNCRVAIWDNGAVIIPNGPAYDKKALVAYDGENFTGNSKEFEIETYHNNLGEWDNKIKSFKLKKGYMATLANNANGTGYSRVFIANDHDLEISSLPEGMENFVSFVRVFRWNWVSKKGKANGYGEKDLLNLTCNYDWNVGGKSDDPDLEYSPIRQNLGWPSWNDINNKQGVTHLLGCNEPDRPDQSNCTVDQVMQMWPEMLKSGLRLGSPAPSSVGTWVGGFFNSIEKYGYRCDFAVAHIYESVNGSTLVSRIKTLSDKGKGRPVWITEWNNGANWTNEGWPTYDGAKCDADCNPILDDNGNTTIVRHPLSRENAEQNRKFMETALPTLDNCDLIERYFEYDWVQDCRALVLNGKLTPAGKVYAAHKAALAYKDMGEKSWEKWKVCPPYPVLSTDKDYRNIIVKWYDHNGETGKKYILERKIDDAADYSVYKEFYLGKDYQAGETVTFTEEIPCTSKVSYRLKALSYKDVESVYSDERTFTRDAAVAAPVLKGEAISTTINKISWGKVSGAKSYRLERAESENGEYQVIADNLTATSYVDENLKVNTTYYYRAYSLNTAAERPISEVLALKTKAFAVPAAMTGVRISGGSSSASLRWDFVYDTYYKVSRSTELNGTYTVVADKVDATSFVDEGLTNGVTYYYKVQPYNEAGSGVETDILTATPQAGLYMHLAFDENKGTKSYDEWGGNDGTFFNSASFTEGRNGGYAAKLVKGSKSYIELPKGAVSRLSDFTVATWIKITGGKGRIFDFGSGSGTFMIAAANGTGVKYKITCAKGAFDFTVPCKWNTTDWHHLVITQKGKDMAVYFDGEEAGTAVNEKKIYPKDMGETKQNWLGRSQWAQDAYCDHVYDDFRIYDYAISADDVQTLFEDKEITTNITEIENRSNSVGTDAVYDLMGRKVATSSKDIKAKGIYIQKGKKFVVK